MKKIILSLLLFVCGVVPAATLTPIQLISPAGSSNGQVITSSGASLSWATPAAAPVSSVAGRTGAIVLSNTDISGLGTASTVNTGTSGSLIPLLSGANVWGGVNTFTSPVFITPALGTPASGVATNLTGTASGLTAGSVTTNANLTGPITSSGNSTAVAAQTGTGSTFAMQTNPVFVGPTLGAATGTSLDGAVIGGSTPAAGSFTTLAASGNGTFSGTGAVQLPSGTTAQEPTGAAGMARYNTTTSRFEFYGTAWRNHVRLDGDTMTGALVVPTLNGNTITTGTGTLTLAASKTLTANNTLTLAGTDSTIITFPTTSATVARTDAANTFTGAQTFSGQILASDGSQSAPSHAFSSETGSGFYRASSGVFKMAIAGADAWQFTATGLRSFSDTGGLQIGSSASSSVTLARDASNTLSQRNGVTAQATRLYNTYTDGSNYERLGINWASNTVTFTTEAAGTGTVRQLKITAPQFTSFAHTNQDIDLSYTYNQPTTGGTVTLASGTQTAIIDPAGTLATLTVTLPGCTSGYDGSIARFSSSQIVTALTVNATSGTVADAPGSLAVGGGNGYLCRGSSTTWYRLY